jgi:hypothetical protein
VQYVRAFQAQYSKATAFGGGSLPPVAPYNFVSDRQGSCLGEIQAICTPKETYERNPDEASLRARVKQLLQDSDNLKI